MPVAVNDCFLLQVYKFFGTIKEKKEKSNG